MTALKAENLPERSACRIVGIHRSTFRTRRKGPRCDAALRGALRKLSTHRYRRGLPWMIQRLRKLGFTDNHKRIERVYRKEKLQLPRRRQSRVRRRGPLVVRPRSIGPNRIWAADFMSDSTRSGRYGRILNLLDEHTRFSIDLHCAPSIPGRKVEEILDRAVAYRGTAPEVLVVDNGPEFVCDLLRRWADHHAVRIHFIEKGKPTQNCFVESFNAIVRREFLTRNWFTNVRELAEGLEEYRRYYNEDREHSSLGWQTPAQFEAAVSPVSPPTAALRSTQRLEPV